MLVMLRLKTNDVVNNLTPTSNVSKKRGLEKNVNLLGKISYCKKDISAYKNR